MNTFRSRTAALFVGDLIFLAAALWASLYLRTLVVPSQELFVAHLLPFSLIFLFSVLVFFIAGLYENRSVIFARRALSATLLVAQVVNVAAAAALFFFLPIFGIAPKTLLFIYLAVSFGAVLLWRVFLFPALGLQRPEPALLIGEGKEMEELAAALRGAPRAPAYVAAMLRPGENLATEAGALVQAHRPRFIIADFSNPRISGAFPNLYNLLFEGIRFVDAVQLYEEVFGRISLSHIDDRWLARNVSRSAHLLYDPFKRLMDIAIALPVAVLSLVFYPFLILAIKLYDGGPIFYEQIRTGENNQPIRMSKFRSMSGTDQGSEMLKSKHTVTPVGRVIRKTRIDEIPQLWSVIKGDMSLIGPRPEFPAMVEEYEKQIPYYGVRHLVRPGLSGWAQLYHDNHPHHGAEVEATKEKLSYDLYYLKHRSLLLDFVIALKTIKKLLTRSGV